MEIQQPTTKKYLWIRTVYLYLFSLVGLVMMIIAGVSFIDMALRTFVFTQADEQERLFQKQPPLPHGIERVEELKQPQSSLSEAEKATVSQWLEDYRRWQNESDRIDPVTAQRQRKASTNLAMIIVGAPLFLYHWSVIRKEAKGRDQS